MMQTLDERMKSMNNESVIFITKDALNRGYLPVYGNDYWQGQTPNIDYLAQKGNVFKSYYTAAPSTVMSNISMFTGQYPYESELKYYNLTHKTYPGKTLFDKANDLGFECHIIWDKAWDATFNVIDRYNVYGENTVFHFPELRQGVGAHYLHEGGLVRNEKKTNKVYQEIEAVFSEITSVNKKVFVWLHVPHVINGRTGYGTDMDAFDHIIGIGMKYFSERNIFISADHGNMDGFRNKLGYGFDVYQPNVLIPLITPKISDDENSLLSNIDIFDILFFKQVKSREYVLSDSTFYAQPNRKLAIIRKDYKYIYNKLNRTEELYDLRTDPAEQFNLIEDSVYDYDRHVTTPSKELYFYPYWDELNEMRSHFRQIKKDVWKSGTFSEEFKPRIKFFIQTHGYNQYRKKVK